MFKAVSSMHAEHMFNPWEDEDARRAKCDTCNDVRPLAVKDCKAYIARGFQGGIVCGRNGCAGIMWLLKDPRN